MKILIACEYSATVRNAFRALGHDAWSCDILPTEREREYHLEGDVLTFLDRGWDMMIAHPPCTYLANSGVRWLYDQGTKDINYERMANLREGAAFFKTLLTARIPKIAVENPIMHKYGRELTGCGAPTQIIHPWMFGHGVTKATCLWLKGLPKLVPTKIIKPPKPEDFPDWASFNAADKSWRQIHLVPRGPERWRIRSRTFQGIADAMAAQWGVA